MDLLLAQATPVPGTFFDAMYRLKIRIGCGKAEEGCVVSLFTNL